MKKLLLSGAALIAMAASPAQAEGLSLDIAGHFKGYAAYNDMASDDAREFDFRKETEVHLTGETTLDNGMTVGVHVELNVDGADEDAGVEESYAYLSGGWGRVNFGDEDGAAYLLQVAAPSADSNVDGIRQYVSSFGSIPGFGGLDYDHAHSGAATKFTYMTPVFNGFQAGVSYTPANRFAPDTAAPLVTGSSIGTGGNPDVSAEVEFEDGWELAARYEGTFEGVGVALGAGYSHYSGTDFIDGTPAAVTSIDDMKAWNVGLDLDYAGFGFGVAYLDETDVAGNVAGALVGAGDVKTWVAGVDYQLGAYKLGLSYLNKEVDDIVSPVAGLTEAEFDRWTGGVTYSYGPGMTFRGSLSYIDQDLTGTADDEDGYEVLVGTQINF